MNGVCVAQGRPNAWKIHFTESTTSSLSYGKVFVCHRNSHKNKIYFLTYNFITNMITYIFATVILGGSVLCSPILLVWENSYGSNSYIYKISNWRVVYCTCVVGHVCLCDLHFDFLLMRKFSHVFLGVLYSSVIIYSYQLKMEWKLFKFSENRCVCFEYQKL